MPALLLETLEVAAATANGSPPDDGHGSPAALAPLLPFLGGNGLGGGPPAPFLGGSSGAGDSDRAPNGSALANGSPVAFYEGEAVDSRPDDPRGRTGGMESAPNGSKESPVAEAVAVAAAAADGAKGSPAKGSEENPDAEAKGSSKMRVRSISE